MIRNRSMKKKSSFVALMTTLCVLFSVSKAMAAEAPIDVTVSIAPQKYFVKEIGGNNVDVNVMVPAGAEPDDYEPTPNQVVLLNKSKLYFSIGVPFEKSWLNKFKSSAKDLTIVDTQQGIERMPMAYNDDGERIPATSGIKDPHIWLSPALVRIQAMNIRDALIKVDPQHQQEYRENYLKFSKKINQIDDALIAITAKIPAAHNQFMTYHPAWGYFATDYGLRQLPIQDEGKEASAQRLKSLIDTAKKQHIKVIFIEPQFSKEQAKVIANAIGGKVVAINPLAEDWGNNLLTVANAFESNVNH